MLEENEELVEKLRELHVKLVNECRNVVKGHKDDIEGYDQVRYQKLATVSLTQLAAVLSVDAGHDIDQFLKVCEANWREAYERAPKWSN